MSSLKEDILELHQIIDDVSTKIVPDHYYTEGYIMANLLTVLRPIFACLSLLALNDGQYALGIVCLMSSLITEYDGSIARKYGSDTPHGALRDIAADVTSSIAITTMLPLLTHRAIDSIITNPELNLAAKLITIPMIVTSPILCMSIAKYAIQRSTSIPFPSAKDARYN